MNRQRLLALLGFSFLLIIATVLGCTTPTPGINWPGGGGSSGPARFAYVVNSQPDSNIDAMAISAYSVDATTGALTPVAGSPFPTDVSGCCGTVWIDEDPLGRFIYVPNLGANSVSVFAIGATGALSEVPGSPFDTGGNDPFVAEVSPDGRFLYVSNVSSGDITAFSVATDGTLTSLGTFVAPFGSPRHLFMDPQGRFLYASDESEGSVIDAYSIQSNGTLVAVPGMPFGNLSCPRSGRVDDAGKFLLVADRCDSSIYVFAIDQTTGALSEVGGSPFPAGPQPFGVLQLPSGGTTYMIVNDLSDGSLYVYSFNETTGLLTPVSGSPFSNLDMSRPHFMDVASATFAYAVDQNASNIVGMTLNAAGQPAPIAGSPFSGGGISQPSQIIFSH